MEAGRDEAAAEALAEPVSGARGNEVNLDLLNTALVLEHLGRGAEFEALAAGVRIPTPRIAAGRAVGSDAGRELARGASTFHRGVGAVAYVRRAEAVLHREPSSA